MYIRRGGVCCWQNKNAAKEFAFSPSPQRSFVFALPHACLDVSALIFHTSFNLCVQRHHGKPFITSNQDRNLKCSASDRSSLLLSGGEHIIKLALLILYDIVKWGCYTWNLIFFFGDQNIQFIEISLEIFNIYVIQERPIPDHL